MRRWRWCHAAGTNPSSIEIQPGCSQEKKDTATVGSCERGAAPSVGHGALYILPLYTGRAGGFGLLVSADTLRVHISLAPAPFGCRGGWNSPVQIRDPDQKAGFPDNSSCLATVTVESTLDPRLPFTSQGSDGCHSPCMAQSGWLTIFFC